MEQDILLLKDQDGVPYALPRAVVESKELVSFRARGELYLMPREELLSTEAAEPATSGSDSTEGLALRTSDSSFYVIPNTMLDRFRATSAAEVAAAETLILAGAEDDVVGHMAEREPLDFDIDRVQDGEGILVGRGIGHNLYIS
jgi:hypothetical protein